MSFVYSNFIIKPKHFFTKFYLTFCFAFCFLVVLWQKARPFFSDRCRFYPSCSDYFLQAVKKHGLLDGLMLGFKRLLRCNPLFEGGVDEVPGVRNGF